MRKNIWYASQNIFLLDAKNEKIINNFVVSVINTSLKKSFSWWYSSYPKLNTLKELKILIPTKEWEPDYLFMNNFINAIKKQYLLKLFLYTQE